MSDFQKYLDSQMNDSEFAAEYEAMQPEHEAIRAVIAARLESRMTQKELAEKTGIRNPILAASKTAPAVPLWRPWPVLPPVWESISKLNLTDIAQNREPSMTDGSRLSLPVAKEHSLRK